jgi:hypothetical protein
MKYLGCCLGLSGGAGPVGIKRLSRPTTVKALSTFEVVNL